jgi:hypothetical protein
MPSRCTSSLCNSRKIAGRDARQKMACTAQDLSFVAIDIDLDELRDQAMIRAVPVEARHQQVNGLQAALLVP